MVFNTEFLSVCVICFRAKFHIPNSYSSIFIAIKLKAKYRFYVVAILVSYVLKVGGDPTQVTYLQRYITI
jgi:hypothetical protein